MLKILWYVWGGELEVGGEVGSDDKVQLDVAGEKDFCGELGCYQNSARR